MAPSSNRLYAEIRPEVAAAITAKASVVALESTLIAQGLPWPANLETALASEAAVREAGAVPASIALIGGVVRIGLEPSDLEAIAQSDGFIKVGRRDLGAAVAGHRDAATTVSATLWLARAVGIGTMATGGLGGVHRGSGPVRDVSADLDALARADGMLVVCSGVKSILDLPATLEDLETRGVLVVGYRTDEFPAFTTPSSGLPLEWRADSPEEAAAIVRACQRLGIPGAIVLARPIEAGAGIPREEMEALIARACDRAAEAGIVGKAITPFLLNAIREDSGGRSLAANRELIVDNARLAGKVAARLAEDRV